ncbi:hypothetical protein P153DRAFT_153521 [Dothidotthia symphoricarpi CBS 119687]|uniref:Uncharacterized protein n=1 Tax=Dothidotthia symphoricarpi CBS 119687 TaxID=1392245 RepID=A0A6A6AQ31_9PLEO|nr:uncharacterized protein P153DRAFT_153521 [Dothidotthia symphoricarpi CBS 119687]KAF2133268.1 hypothetical protein P153DRAFT_153521 [Dothidotthia symphoricarpi CBS 119687]
MISLAFHWRVGGRGRLRGRRTGGRRRRRGGERERERQISTRRKTLFFMFSASYHYTTLFCCREPVIFRQIRCMARRFLYLYFNQFGYTCRIILTWNHSCKERESCTRIFDTMSR